MIRLLVVPHRRKATIRLDELLVKTGHLENLREATGWIMAGKVVVSGRVCDKPGQLVARDAEIVLRGVPEKYASRGGYKLEAALARFRLDVTGRTVLDAGASTGGFTDCLLQHGAAKTFSVDVGFGQLRGKLASDPRVINLERTNVSDLRREQFDPPIDLAVVDLSYLALAKAIPVVRDLFSKPVEIICLVKPLYEGVSQENFNAPEELTGALVRLTAFLRDQGLVLRDVMLSPILGGSNTIEFLAHVADTGESAPASAIVEAIAEIPIQFPSLGNT